MNKFITFKSRGNTEYVIPHMITHVTKPKDYDYVVIHLFSGKDIFIDESIDDVLKKIKDADSIKFNL